MEKAVVDQLLFELNRDRMKVSEAAQQLVSFTENHQSKDHLVIGIPKSMNPFKDKDSCSML